MKQILYLILVFSHIQVFSQLSRQQELSIDSLKKCINTASHDTIKINAYNAWDNLIYVTNPKLDYDLNQKIVELAEKNLKKTSLSKSEVKTFNIVLSQALNSLGIITYNEGNNDKAISYYSRSLKIRSEHNDKKGVAATLNNLGIVHQDLGDYAKAITDYTQSLKTNEEIGDRNGEANSLSNIGRIYYEQGDTAKAIDYQTRSLKIREAIGDKRGMAIAYNNLGTIFSDQGHNAKAMEYLNRGLKISEEIGDKNKIALALANIGAIYKKEQNDQEAMDFFNRSLKMFKELGNEKWIASILSHIGDIYKKKNETDKAIENYQKALSMAQSAGLVSVTKDVSQSLSVIYKITGNYKDAFKMYQLYITMRDSIVSEKSQKKIMQQEMKYFYNKRKALDAKEYEKQNAVAAEREQKQKVIIYFIACSLILVMVFALFALNRWRFTEKQKAIIEEQKNLVEGKQKEILSSITYAKRLQDAILPPDHYVKSVLPESFIFYKPKDIVAGDFYWMEQKGELLFLAAADCTGHGVPGAIVSVICGNALNRAVLEFGIEEPGKILDKTRELVLDTFSKSGTDVKDGMDISLISINTISGKIKWSGANNPLWCISDSKLTEIKGDKQAIGKTDNPLPFTTHTIPLVKGDSFYLFTDGFADQFGGAQGKKFKYTQLKEIILKNSSLAPEEQKAQLEALFLDWIGSLEQIDDVCLIGVKISEELICKTEKKL